MIINILCSRSVISVGSVVFYFPIDKYARTGLILKTTEPTEITERVLNHLPTKLYLFSSPPVNMYSSSNGLFAFFYFVKKEKNYNADMEHNPSIAVIIDTHNCKEHLERNFHSLLNQTRKPDQIVIIDNSNDSTYLDPYRKDATVIKNTAELGQKTDYVLFLNSDAFLTNTFIAMALEFMERPENAPCGAMTGILLGFIAAEETPSGLYESTGIFCTPYGKWFDRDQGQPVNSHLYKKPEEVPALRGALMFCRRKALDEVVWNNKDDIDLSLSLRKKGWKLMFFPELVVYHCTSFIPAMSE